MKLKIFIILILFGILTAIPLRAELVFLNDGSIIEGEIIEDSKESITIEDGYSILHEIQRKNILRIRPSIQMGKVYIQKHNGEGIYAHIVDENNTFYTLRTELDNSDEFTVRKRDVLFISNLAPSELQGFVETNQIYLTWTEPQIPVKHYRVYYTTGINEKYKLDGIATDNSYVLKNISSNKTYYIIVTSVGTDNYESPPGNELVITVESISLPQKEIVAQPEETVPDKKTYSFNTALLIKPMYLRPHGDWNELVDYGHGGSIGLLYHKLGSNSALFSLDAGYLRWAKDNKNLDYNMYMIPATMSFGYRFCFTDRHAISALVGGGGIYISDTFYMALFGKEKKHPFELLFTGSVNFELMGSGNLSVFMGGGFNSIYKKDKEDIDKKHKFKKFATYHLGISMRLL